MCAILCHSASSIMMPHSVILNGVKNLEVSVAVDGSTSLEILRYTQHDIVSEPTTPKITKSRNHAITGGGGSVISVILL